MKEDEPKFTGWWHGTFFVDGMSVDPKEAPDNEVIGCDKPNHAERSIANQPNHLKQKGVYANHTFNDVRHEKGIRQQKGH